MIKPYCMREGKIREKKKREEWYCRRTVVVAKTEWCGIRCSSVLKSSACKFSEEKMNQIVVSLCKCICLETLIFYI